MADQNKLIIKVANASLLPAGLVQKGKSPIFLDDQGWFTTMVEFQPHKRRFGAYLNVGANFHWFVVDHLSFDMGYRMTDFAEFDTERQFTSKVQAMVDLALTRCRELRGALADLTTARAAILAHEFSSDSLWGNYHRGIASGLCGDAEAARGYFGTLMADPWDAPWAMTLKEKARELVGVVAETGHFEASVRDLVNQARAAKGLPAVTWSWASGQAIVVV